ncbi:hypothetical protein BDW75DRAFT_39846 [Aspergillus navahoensis]
MPAHTHTTIQLPSLLSVLVGNFELVIRAGHCFSSMPRSPFIRILMPLYLLSLLSSNHVSSATGTWIDLACLGTGVCM